MADQQYLDLLNNAIGGTGAQQPRTPEETAMLWSAFGSSLQGGTPFFEAVRSMQSQRQQDALNKIKLLDMRQKLMQQQKVGDILSGAGEQSPAQAGLAAGAAAGQAGPTLGAAEVMNAQPAMSPAKLQAERYRKAATALASTNPEQSKLYLDMAEKFDPTPEYGQPVVERGLDGKPIVVQYGKRGERMVVQGAQPKADFQTLNLGGTTRLVDVSQLSGPQTFQHTMTPGDVASNAIARQRLALDQNAYDIKETPEGLVYVPKVPSMQGRAIPVMGEGGQVQGAGGQITEDMRKSAGFSLRMSQASKALNQPVLDAAGKPVLDETGKPMTLEQVAGKPGFNEAAVGLVPFAGGAMERGAARSAGTNRQLYRQAQENWVTANLRAESGAVIGDSEMEKEVRKYFPQYGDPAEVIAQKADARKQAEAAMQARAGAALKGVSAAYGGMAGAQNAPVQPALQNVQGPRPLMWDPKTRSFK